MILKGLVEAGAGRGKSQFVPTINVLLKDDIPAELRYGVYCCNVNVFGVGLFKGVVHFGPRESIDGLITFEVHLLDFSSDIYGVEVEVEVMVNRKIRDIIKFESLEDLKLQILSDIEVARGLLTD